MSICGTNISKASRLTPAFGGLEVCYLTLHHSVFLEVVECDGNHEYGKAYCCEGEQE